MATGPKQDLHEAAGAAPGEDRRWSIPGSYGDPEGEYRAVREGAGLVDRSDRGKLRVTGKDRTKFLHGMLTHTVTGLSEGEGNHNALTDAKGATQADMRLTHRGDHFTIETAPGAEERVQSFLDRYIIGDDVTMEEVTGAFAILGVHGPRAAKVLESVLGEAPDLALHHHAPVRWGEGTLTVVRSGYTGEDGFDLWVDPADAGALWKALQEAGARPVGREALEVLRVEAGVPEYGVDADEKGAPLEMGMADAVDFTKGCFLGQEVLAKMRNLGKPRRHLVGLRIEGDPPARDTALYADGKEAGRTRTAVHCLAVGGSIALASVRRGYEEAGTALETEDGKRATVEALPFSARRDSP